MWNWRLEVGGRRYVDGRFGFQISTHVNRTNVME